tara:strand:+ start:1979 stop:2770 length:792 start_codon:yes stop_codon:yes gene_type:complete
MLKNIPQPEEILVAVKKNDFVIYNDAFDMKVLDEMKSFWIKFFNEKNRNNFKSTDLYGSTRSIGDDNYNSFRKDKDVGMYRRSEFPWNKSENKLTQKLISELNQTRNLALGLNKNHGMVFDADLEVSFSQVNCYPSNEGEMFPHKDTKKDGILLSCMFNITSKKVDFDEGGLYLIIDNKKIDIDALMSPCSVIFYNGNLVHGVDKIYSKSNVGRIAGYPMKQFFLAKSRTPNYIKKIIRIDNAIRRRLNLGSAVKQGNSAIKK